MFFYDFPSFFSFFRVDGVEGPPILTFYTKDPCPLCDIVMEELEPYKDKLKIEKVDITKKENLRWLKLYRLDIPVLFLNGKFLCMHKLNHHILQKRLHDIEAEKQKLNSI